MPSSLFSTAFLFAPPLSALAIAAATVSPLSEDLDLLHLPLDQLHRLPLSRLCSLFLLCILSPLRPPPLMKPSPSSFIVTGPFSIASTAFFLPILVDLPATALTSPSRPPLLSSSLFPSLSPSSTTDRLPPSPPHHLPLLSPLRASGSKPSTAASISLPSVNHPAPPFLFLPSPSFCTGAGHRSAASIASLKPTVTPFPSLDLRQGEGIG